MSSLSIYTKLETLPSGIKKEVEKLIDSAVDRSLKKCDHSGKSNQKRRLFGSLKGKIHMAEDFDNTPGKLFE